MGVRSSFKYAILTILAAATFGSACQTPQSTSTQTLLPTTFFPSGIAAFVTDVKAIASASSTDGSQKPGHTAAGSASLTVTASGQANVVSNGGSLVALHGSAPFNKVFVSLANAGATVDGFWEVDLPAAMTDQTVLVRFVASLPAANFDLHFQVASAAGVVSQQNVISETVTSDSTTLLPQVTASYSPSPVPFSGGSPCVATGELGCLWEFKVMIQEFNGIAVNAATLNETYTFTSGETLSRSVPIIIGGASTSTVIRTLACEAATVSCVPADELAGGTYTYFVGGTDINGNNFSFTGPTLVLLGR